MPEIAVKKELSGSILDVGGGGEGVIGQVYGARVTAIDNRQEELDEAPGGFAKILMDAAQLSFPDRHFDNVTFFFSLMFMDHGTQRRALAEAARVLKPGGKLVIWDAVIEAAYPEPFVVDLSVDAAGKRIQTTYGVLRQGAGQDASSLLRLCAEAGLGVLETEAGEGVFKIACQKQ